MQQLTIRAYKDASFIVEGETKKYHQYLKNLKGKWNKNLTDPFTHQRIEAWVYSNDKYDIIKQFVDRVNSGEDPETIFRSLNRHQTIKLTTYVPIVGNIATIFMDGQIYQVNIINIGYSITGFVHQAIIQWSNSQLNIIELRYDPIIGNLEWQIKDIIQPHKIIFL